MPKSQTIEEKYINGIKVDKENEECFFNDEEHTYYDKNTMQQYISVTTLIGKYCEEFDEDFWSSYKAMEAILDIDTWLTLKKVLLAKKKFDNKLINKLGVDEKIFLEKKQEILDQYKAKREEACTHGTKIHLGKELSFYNRDNFDFGKYGFSNLKGIFDCKEDYYKLDSEKGVYPEFLISITSKDGILKVSGQIDCLIKDHNDIFLIDWKGLDINTPILTENGWKTMGTLTLQDKVYDKDGNLVKIRHISSEHFNPCYEITFDDGEKLIADEEHNWLVDWIDHGNTVESVKTTEEIYEWIKNPKKGSLRIYNPSPIEFIEQKHIIDPYVFGVWFASGDLDKGYINTRNKEVWKELSRRKTTLLKPKDSKKTTRKRVSGLSPKLERLNVLNNKHIPEEYIYTSIKDRLNLLRGIMDARGEFHLLRKCFRVKVSSSKEAESLKELLITLGIKPRVTNFSSAQFVYWNNFDINPFLVRHKERFKNHQQKSEVGFYRRIISVEKVKTVTTKCIEVISPSHTYLAGKSLIVTHNTNAKIEKESYYNKATKSRKMMKYPLNNLQDCTLNHYFLQLSLYAYILQQLHPEFNISGLKIIHIDREGKETEIDVPYLKDDVERMLKHYKKQIMMKNELDKDIPYIK